MADGCQSAETGRQGLDVAEVQALIDGAYQVGMSRQEIIQYYKALADSDRYRVYYAEEFYKGPIHVSAAIKKYTDHLPRDAPILDVAAGTGLLGERLRMYGFTNLHALEPSETMAQQANEKSIYTKTFIDFLGGEKSEIMNGVYDVLTCSGGFGEGHIPTSALSEMIRIVKPGGYIIFGIREECFWTVEDYRDKLEPFMGELAKEGHWEMLERTKVPGWCTDKPGVVFVFKVLHKEAMNQQS